jgi:protein-S-isoprenylcysteine O-methyltransferase Ste14
MTAQAFVPIIATAVVYAVRLREIGAKRDTVAGKVQESFTFRLFLVVGTVVTLSSLTEYLMRGWFSWFALVGGLILAAISFKLRWAAIAALGRFWSLHVEIRDNHEFVRSGPFRFIRHPTYFSMILELVAFALICSAWWTLALIPIIFIPALILRLRLEEPALVSKFGDTYREYQRRVPMLVPYKWDLPK